MSARHTDIITRPVRRVLEDEIERLIAMLDEIDGDADLEPDGDDEDTHDREDVDDREHDTADEEPTLGWTVGHQFGALGPQGDDCELVCEDEGDPDWGIGDLDGLLEQTGIGYWSGRVE